jgi:hypothetical protein
MLIFCFLPENAESELAVDDFCEQVNTLPVRMNA